MINFERWPLAIGGLIVFAIAWVIQAIADLGFIGMVVAYILFAIGGKLVVMGVWRSRGETKAITVKQPRQYPNRRRYSALFVPLLAVLILLPGCQASAPGYYTMSDPPGFTIAGNQQLWFDDFDTDDTGNYDKTSMGSSAYNPTLDRWDLVFNAQTHIDRNLTVPLVKAGNSTLTYELKTPPSYAENYQMISFGICNKSETPGSTGMGTHNFWLQMQVYSSGNPAAPSVAINLYGPHLSLHTMVWGAYYDYGYSNSVMRFTFNRIDDNITVTVSRNNVLMATTRMSTIHPGIPTAFDRMVIFFAGSSGTTSGYSIDNIGQSAYTNALPLAHAEASASAIYAGQRVMFDCADSLNYTDVYWTLNYNGGYYNSTEVFWNFTFNQTGNYIVQLNVTDGVNFDLDIIGVDVQDAPVIPVTVVVAHKDLLTETLDTIAGSPTLLILIILAVIFLIAIVASGRKRRR